MILQIRLDMKLNEMGAWRTRPMIVMGEEVALGHGCGQIGGAGRHLISPMIDECRTAPKPLIRQRGPLGCRQIEEVAGVIEVEEFR